MAYDRDDTDFHLTPRGWESDLVPDDRVETWNRYMNQQTGWSREHVKWTCKWADPDTPRAERDALREKYRDFMGVEERTRHRDTTIGKPL